MRRREKERDGERRRGKEKEGECRREQERAGESRRQKERAGESRRQKEQEGERRRGKAAYWSKLVPPTQTSSPPAVEPCVRSSELIVIELDCARKVYAPTRLTASPSLPSSSSVATRTVVLVPAAASGEGAAAVRHSSVPTTTLTAVQLASSVEPSSRLTRTRLSAAAKPVPVRVSCTPPAAEPLLGLTAARLRAPAATTEPSCNANPRGGTCTRIGEGEADAAQSGITQLMLVALYEATAHARPSQTETVGAPVPLAKPEPVSSREALRATAADDAEVRVGVAPASKAKLHGSPSPLVESESGRR